MAVFEDALLGENLLAFDGDVFDDSMAAVVGEGGGVDGGVAVALVEEMMFFLGRVPATHEVSADGHEVALFGGDDEGVPVDEVEVTIGGEVEISGVDVGVADDLGRGIGLAFGRFLAGTVEQLENY